MLDNICNAVRDDFEIGNMSFTHNLKDALDNLHTVGDSMLIKDITIVERYYWEFKPFTVQAANCQERQDI